MGTSYNSSIVTDGLVLCLDAANPRSYSGAGSTWSDLSGNGNHASLINNPTFVDNKYFYFFDSSNDTDATAVIPVSTSLQSSYFTFSIWFRLDNTNTQSLFTSHFQANGTISGIVFTVSPSGGSQKYMIQTRLNKSCCQTLYLNPAQINIWTNICGTYDGSFIKGYINGVYTGSLSASGTHYQYNDFVLGNNSDQVANGDYTNIYNTDNSISYFIFYNRALSAQEIRQNYNATRGRYGN